MSNKLVISTVEGAELVCGNKWSTRAFLEIMREQGVRPVRTIVYRRGGMFVERCYWARATVLRAVGVEKCSV